jgi:polysaccharide deacetylase family protein (PEP-CTERM system associated)
MSHLNAFTVDVEDYFQVSAFEAQVNRSDWDRYHRRVEANTHRILALLERRRVKATFFVLGWVADRCGRLVREIHQRGHKIGSHGYWHRLIYQQSPDEFRQDLRRSKDVLEQVTGERVTAFRAPSFSITKRSRWALDVLVEEGFRLDSSIFPAYHYRYGIPGAEPGVHPISTSAGTLWEFPPSVARVARLNIPVSGGGYFRLYPLAMTLRLLSMVNRRHMRPFVFYVHPWELDPEQPRVAGSSWLSTAKHRLNLAATESRLDTLLEVFRFGPLCAATLASNGRCPADRAPHLDLEEICAHCPGRRGCECDLVELPEGTHHAPRDEAKIGGPLRVAEPIARSAVPTTGGNREVAPGPPKT